MWWTSCIRWCTMRNASGSIERLKFCIINQTIQCSRLEPGSWSKLRMTLKLPGNLPNHQTLGYSKCRICWMSRCQRRRSSRRKRNKWTSLVTIHTEELHRKVHVTSQAWTPTADWENPIANSKLCNLLDLPRVKCKASKRKLVKIIPIRQSSKDLRCNQP